MRIVASCCTPFYLYLYLDCVVAHLALPVRDGLQMTGQPAASVSRRVAAECRRVARAAVFSNGDSTSSVASTAAAAGAAALARPLPPDRSDAPFRRLNSVRLEMLQALQTGLVSRPIFQSRYRSWSRRFGLVFSLKRFGSVLKPEFRS